MTAPAVQRAPHDGSACCAEEVGVIGLPGSRSGGAQSVPAPSAPPASGASTARNRSGGDRLITPPSASWTDTCSCAATCELIARSSNGRPSSPATRGAMMLPPAP